MELLAYDGDVQEKLRAYATAALDALEIRIGPAHCELMWVDDQPVLMEIGARLSAGNNATLSRTCGGVCALDLTIAAYLDPRGFAAGIESHPKLKLAPAVEREAQVLRMARARNRGPLTQRIHPF